MEGEEPTAWEKGQPVRERYARDWAVKADQKQASAEREQRESKEGGQLFDRWQAARVGRKEAMQAQTQRTVEAQAEIDKRQNEADAARAAANKERDERLAGSSPEHRF